MIGKFKRRLSDFLYAIADGALESSENGRRKYEANEQKCSPATKTALRALYLKFQNAVQSGHGLSLQDAGLRVFSQFEEDGILLYLFAAIGMKSRCFVDVGSADGINSNCANLAINFGWHGLFIDGDGEKMERGRQFYKNHPDTWIYPPKFVEAFVQRENINQLISDAGISGEIDLLSIDIDGNDYWVWDALEVVQPRVVMVETHIEFGMRSIVVPYDKDYSYPGRHPDYHGASPVAMAKLAAKKGYRLVGANGYGFNTIYIKNGVGENLVPRVSVESILSHPRNKERVKLFEPIKDWIYETV